MGDETTDRATTSQMVFLYRTADPFVGKPEIVFSSIEALHHGGSADAVTATTLSCLKRDSVPLSRCCSFCGDGCGVIIGCENGLAARFCARNPYMLFNHCFCHRCALGSRDGSHSIKYLKHVVFPYIEYLARWFARFFGPHQPFAGNVQGPQRRADCSGDQWLRKMAHTGRCF